MYQPIDKQFIKTDKEAETGDAGNHALKDVAYLIQHKVTFQPVGDITRRFISAAFRHRTVLTELQHLFHRVVITARFCGVALVPLLFSQQVLNGTVQRKIRIAANRRGKVCIRLQRQAKVPAVFRIVNRLLH